MDPTDCHLGGSRDLSIFASSSFISTCGDENLWSLLKDRERGRDRERTQEDAGDFFLGSILKDSSLSALPKHIWKSGLMCKCSFFQSQSLYVLSRVTCPLSPPSSPQLVGY
jgi:hypothetical protein